MTELSLGQRTKGERKEGCREGGSRCGEFKLCGVASASTTADDGPRVEETDRGRATEGGKSFYLAAAAASPNFLSRGDTLARVAKHTRTHAHTGAKAGEAILLQ